MSAEPAAAGTIATFYSFKGGGGRSMALANVAWALATNGLNVLAVDWDFEAPGLHRYFHSFLDDPEQIASNGLIDAVWNYVRERLDAGQADDTTPADRDFSDIVQGLDLPHGSLGSLSFIGAGRQDDTYSQKVGGFDWTTFYTWLSGRAYFESFAAWARSHFDAILLDSRTGLSDSAGVCTVQIPDKVVLTFVYNRQSIDGTAAVARSIKDQTRAMGRRVELLAVPMRVEDDRRAASAAREHSARLLSGTLTGGREEIERRLRLAEIKHHSWCGFEEKLAAFAEEPDDRGSLLGDMHALASQLFRKVEPRRFATSDRARYWNRAAFTDSRLADTQMINRLEKSEGMKLLRSWLQEALSRPKERADWQAELAKACVMAANSFPEPHHAKEVDQLAKGGLEILRRINVGGRGRYASEFVRLLLLRAHQLRALGRTTEAQMVIEEASDVPGLEGVEALLLARAFEWQSDYAQAMNDHERAARCLARCREIYGALAETDASRLEDLARVLLSLSRSSLFNGQQDEALTYALEAREAIERFELGGETATTLYIDALVHAARRLAAARRLGEARKVSDLLIERVASPSDDAVDLSTKADVLGLRAEILLAAGDVSGAEGALGAVDKLRMQGCQPSVETLAIAAELHQRLGNQALAVALAEEGLKAVTHTTAPAMQVKLILTLTEADRELGVSRRDDEWYAPLLSAVAQADPDALNHEAVRAIGNIVRAMQVSQVAAEPSTSPAPPAHLERG